MFSSFLSFMFTITHRKSSSQYAILSLQLSRNTAQLFASSTSKSLEKNTATVQQLELFKIERYAASSRCFVVVSFQGISLLFYIYNRYLFFFSVPESVSDFRLVFATAQSLGFAWDFVLDALGYFIIIKTAENLKKKRQVSEQPQEFEVSNVKVFKCHRPTF